MKLIPPPHPSGDMPLCRCPSFFQASATYFALDESCSMLYLRLTGSTTLKPKGRCSVQKPGSSCGFYRKFPWSWRRAFGFATRLGLFTTFSTPNEVLKTRPNKKKQTHTSNVGTMFVFKFFLFGKIDRLPLVTLNFVWLLTMKSSLG